MKLGQGYITPHFQCPVYSNKHTERLQKDLNAQEVTTAGLFVASLPFSPLCKEDGCHPGLGKITLHP